MKEVKNDLLTNKYTVVCHEEDTEIKHNAPHHFKVFNKEETLCTGWSLSSLLGEVNFQEGPIKESGVNGVMNEDLLVMVLIRLQSFQDSEFRCKENAMAITKIEEALLWLRKRTMGREQKGIEGTHIVEKDE